MTTVQDFQFTATDTFNLSIDIDEKSYDLNVEFGAKFTLDGELEIEFLDVTSYEEISHETGEAIAGAIANLSTLEEVAKSTLEDKEEELREYFESCRDYSPN